QGDDGEVAVAGVALARLTLASLAPLARGRAVDALGLRHAAVALEEDAFLDDDHRGLDVTEHAGAAAQLHPLAGEHVAHDLAADDDGAAPDGGLDAALL